MRASDHAVLRYLERKLGVELEAARIRIEQTFAPARMQSATEWADGAGMRVVHDGMVFCCRGRTVTTRYRKGPESPRVSGRAGRTSGGRQSGRSVGTGTRPMESGACWRHRDV